MSFLVIWTCLLNDNVLFILTNYQKHLSAMSFLALLIKKDLNSIYYIIWYTYNAQIVGYAQYFSINITAPYQK